MDKAREGNAVVVLRGSALTGLKWDKTLEKYTGRPFDGGPKPSDFDFAIVSNSLFEKAKKLGVKLREEGARTDVLRSRHLESLKLGGLNKAVSDRVGKGRPFSFVVFPDAQTLKESAPYMVVQLGE